MYYSENIATRTWTVFSKYWCCGLHTGVYTIWK